MEIIRNDGHKTKSPVLIQLNIGLERESRYAIVENLNRSLANEALLTIKTRCAFWNVSGMGFMEMRVLFDSQYKQLNKFTDEIAERTRILGGIAIGSLQEFIQYARIEEQPGIVPDILHLLADHEAIIRFLREDSRKCTDEYEDEGTSDLLINIMCLHEKMAWTLRSHIEPELTYDDIRIT